MNDVPTRRDVLTGAVRPGGSAVSADHDHISSAVVSVLPARRDEVMALLSQLPGAEVHYSNASKLVVVLEGPGSGALGGMLAEISGWPGVLSANMVFEQRLEQEN